MILWRIARNLLGLLLIIVGLILWLTPVVPGGALMIPGLMLIDFPGKRRLFLRLEKTRLISRLLKKHKSVAQIWKRLYLRPNMNVFM